MTTQTKKPPLERMALENTPLSYKLKFPPFGKRLDDLRRAGKIPAMRVIVATDWSIGKLFPRIVITDELPAASLRFNYLSGLHVQIVYFDRDNQLLESLITEILSIQPATLSALNMDAVKQGKPAFKLIFSHSAMEAE